jgi:hypothetical protein
MPRPSNGIRRDRAVSRKQDANGQIQDRHASGMAAVARAQVRAMARRPSIAVSIQIMASAIGA